MPLYSLDFGPLYASRYSLAVSRTNCLAVCQIDLLIYDLHNKKFVYRHEFQKHEDSPARPGFEILQFQSALSKEVALKCYWDDDFSTDQDRPDLLVATSGGFYRLSFRKQQIQCEEISERDFADAEKREKDDDERLMKLTGTQSVTSKTWFAGAQCATSFDSVDVVGPEI